MSIKASVVVCTYNAKNDLRECLKSLENQDYDEKELIVVNDASEDGTLEFLQDFQRRAKIKTIVTTNKSNRGVAGSRNVGTKLATGDIIAFTDADCMADRQWISELVKGFSMENVHAVGGSILSQNTKNIWELLDKRNNFVASKEDYVSYVQGCNMSFDANVLRKYLFNDEIKYGYEETLLCDYLLNDGYKIYYRPQAVVHHKCRNDFLSLLKLKYRRGLSSIWYRKKQKKFFVLKRHLILLFALLCLPFFVIHKFWLFLACILFLVFSFSLIRDEVIFRTKSNKEIFITSPFLVLIEFAHFWGSLVGIVKFRILKIPDRK